MLDGAATESETRACHRRLRGRREQAALLDEAHDGIDTLARLKIGEYERPLAAHPARVAVHDFERGADERRQIDLVG